MRFTCLTEKRRVCKQKKIIGSTYISSNISCHFNDNFSLFFAKIIHFSWLGLCKNCLLLHANIFSLTCSVLVIFDKLIVLLSFVASVGNSNSWDFRKNTRIILFEWIFKENTKWGLATLSYWWHHKRFTGCFNILEIAINVGPRVFSFSHVDIWLSKIVFAKSFII